MSEKQHAKDIEQFEDLHAKSGACLNRHVSAFEQGNTCSHRWQAFQDATAHSSLYNDKFDPGKRIKTSAWVSSGKLWPPWYKQTLTSPKNGNEWNVGEGSNFKEKCYIPYWHNAHHIVPNGELRGAIAACGKGFKSPSKVVWVVREGLLKVAYNLNDQKNMIILPMDRAIGRELSLPVHLATITARSHGAYSRNVRDRLDSIFAPIKLKLEEHGVEKPPSFTGVKRDVEALSAQLHDAIVAAGKSGVKHLDAMPKPMFAPPRK